MEVQIDLFLLALKELLIAHQKLKNQFASKHTQQTAALYFVEEKLLANLVQLKRFTCSDLHSTRSKNKISTKI